MVLLQPPTKIFNVTLQRCINGRFVAFDVCQIKKLRIDFFGLYVAKCPSEHNCVQQTSQHLLDLMILDLKVFYRKMFKVHHINDVIA
mmetsp:Transcript_12805/g.22055  ORF Transcript_12805/g.22055 Transcript_12805/m.22055 type:complete len:87 (+) Transcript_12805:874-1134(+)